MASKVRKGWIAACAMLCAGALVAGGVALRTPTEDVSAADGGKILYYVDCGAYSKTEDGLGDYPQDRILTGGHEPETGYPRKNPTPFMEKYGLSFGTSDSIAQATPNTLYNSVTDQLNAEDAATGKYWGFNEYNDGYNSWRYMSTGANNSVQSGFNHSRYSEEADIVYTFEVDDTTTDLTVTLGVRVAPKWEHPSTYQVNSSEAKSYTGKSNEDQTFTETGVHGVDSEGKSLVTITFAYGGGQYQPHISWIMITTADYELPETADLDGFVHKGDTTIKGQMSASGEQDFTIEEASKTAINEADYFEDVEITASYNGRSFTDTVTVLPKKADIKYLVDAGSTTAEEPFSQDVAYSADTHYGYTNETPSAGSMNWADAGWKKSIHNGTKVEGAISSVTYRFEIDATGTYCAVVGSPTPDNSWWGREQKISVVGNENVTNGTSVTGNPHKDQTGWLYHDYYVYGDVTIADGSANFDVKIETTENKTEFIVSYILIYKVNKVTYDVNEGTMDEEATQYYDIGATGSLPTPHKDNYTFGGWYKSETYGEDEKVEDLSGVTESVELHALWIDPTDVTKQIQKWGVSDVPETLKKTVTETTKIVVKGIFPAATNVWDGFVVDINVNNAWFRLRMDPAAFGLIPGGGDSGTDKGTDTWTQPLDPMYDNLERSYTKGDGDAYLALYQNGGKALIVTEASLKNNVLTYVVKTYASTDTECATLISETTFKLTSTSPVTQLVLNYYYDGTQPFEEAHAYEEDVPEPETYTVTYALGDHAATDATKPGDDTATEDGGYKVTLPAAPKAAKGWEFEGWKVGEENDLKDAEAQIDVSASVTVTAQWKAIEYTLVFADGKPGDASADVSGMPAAGSAKVSLVSTTYTAGTDPTLDGYTFVGWTWQGSETPSKTFTLTESLIPEGGTNITLTANWTKNAEPEPETTYTVTYAVGDHAKAGEQPHAADTANEANGYKVTLPEAPEAEDGYKFTGWKVGSDPALKQPGTQIDVTADVTVTAQWEAEQQQPEPETTYTVTYELGDHAKAGETAPTQAAVTSGTEITLAAAPEAEDGWKFAGWQIGSDVKQPDEKVAITANTTITAKWEEDKTEPEPPVEDKVTVTFDYQYENHKSSEEIDKGGKATKPANPTREGYTFKGWYTAAEGGTEFDFTQTLDADTTIYAQWTKNPAPAKKGCGGSVAASAAAIGALAVTLGGALFIKKKHNDR